MTQRRFHYEQAFEHYLRANRVPYVAVDEARKTLLPAHDPLEAIKSFDFVVYGAGWQELFGAEFQAVFVFVYCLRQQPPDALFEELFSFGERWYVLREAPLEAYRQAMVVRSRKWRTVHVPADTFRRISRPFNVRPPAGGESACQGPPTAIC